VTNLGQDKQTKDAVNGLATFALGWVLGVWQLGPGRAAWSG